MGMSSREKKHCVSTSILYKRLHKTFKNKEHNNINNHAYTNEDTAVFPSCVYPDTSGLWIGCDV